MASVPVSTVGGDCSAAHIVELAARTMTGSPLTAGYSWRCRTERGHRTTSESGTVTGSGADLLFPGLVTPTDTPIENRKSTARYSEPLLYRLVWAVTVDWRLVVRESRLYLTVWVNPAFSFAPRIGQVGFSGTNALTSWPRLCWFPVRCW